MREPEVLLRRLVWVQHVIFGVLVVVGLAHAVSTGVALLPLIVAAAVLVGLYVVGALRGGGRWWLPALTVAWVACVVVTPALAWVAFSLWLLGGHLLGLRAGVVHALVVLVVVVAATSMDTGWTLGGVVGPAAGAAFAVALSRGQDQLVRDTLERRRLLDELVRAQQETEQAQAGLLRAQRESGVLAERARLSRDIHDTLAQDFSSVLLLARAALAQDPAPSLRSLLGQVESTAAAGLEESRRVVGALAPAALEDSGLAAALQRLLDELESATAVTTTLEVVGAPAGLPASAEVALLRTAQGAIANVRQHAHADSVHVRLEVLDAEEAPGAVGLVIADDGRGFDVDALLDGPAPDVAAGGYGLRATRDRLRALGGSLRVDSSADGTTMCARLPLGREWSQS